MNSIPRIINMIVTDDLITAELADGRLICVPLAWSWRLSDAMPEQRSRFEIIGSGLGVHWPDIDEDISASGMLYGVYLFGRSSATQLHSDIEHIFGLSIDKDCP